MLPRGVFRPAVAWGVPEGPGGGPGPGGARGPGVRESGVGARGLRLTGGRVTGSQQPREIDISEYYARCARGMGCLVPWCHGVGVSLCHGLIVS